MQRTKLRNKFYFFLAMAGFVFQQLSAQIVPAQYKENKSFTYDEVIRYYKLLDKKYSKATLIEKGSTDIGKPLHIFLMYGGKNFEKEVINKREVSLLLIMNGIHPGEPDGIDASLHLAEWVLEYQDSLLKNTAIAIIPVYNVDGALNRGCCSRVNQDGPEAYGFRGNAKNLDLNRDFIKLDTRNAQSYVQVFQWLQPDLFIDTHVSNGADYQYTFTLIPTLRDRMENAMGEYLYNTILPGGEQYMNKAGWDVAPYVNSLHEIPDSGLAAFNDSPRYSSGYATLFNTPGFVVETHMLKPFPRRVEATLSFLKFGVEFIHMRGEELKKIKKRSELHIANTKTFALNYTLDKNRFENILFKGYTATYILSQLTGKTRLKYDTGAPYEKDIKFYQNYTPAAIIEKPDYYIIPQAWTEVIDRLAWNGVTLTPFTKDTLMEVEAYKILDYTSSSAAYEGHYMNKNVKLEKTEIRRMFYKGDIMVKTGTKHDYFLATVLEPIGNDSYFAWGFFNSILQQKEWFSDYVWEDMAYDLYTKDATLKKSFDEKKQADTAFANNSWEQLYFIYKNSPYFEELYMEYPVYRAP